jgi:hypothetical protein
MPKTSDFVDEGNYWRQRLAPNRCMPQCSRLESNPLSVNGHTFRITYVSKQEYAVVADSIPACIMYVSGGHKTEMVWLELVACKK